MQTLYDKIYGELATRVTIMVIDGELDRPRGEELKRLISDWLCDKEREDNDIKAQAMTRLFRWGDEADQVEADQEEADARVEFVRDSAREEGIVL